MAYVNVAEWKTDQVCEWLKGLDNSVLPYVHSFTNNKVSGQQLLSLRPEDMEHLGVLKMGHQEIILEAVEYLRNFHYELDRENLQLLALRLSCQAHSLHNELSRQTDSKPVTTQTLSDVVGVVASVKPLVRWLDRPPFSGQLEYNDKKIQLLKLSIEMATCAQRDRFAEKPIEEIRTTCGELAQLADYIIQDISDPMILQPASLDLATLKKRPGDDLGFYILPSFHGTHQIAEIKFSSQAHQCGKMEEGDEIVQVNYQTVVGWERKNVLGLFHESPAEILLTLKRRPRHTKVYGQIYIKPYRLPSNKKTPYATRWQHNLPSPRPELLTIPDFTMPLPRHTPKDPSPEPASVISTVSMLDTMATDSSDSDSEVEPPVSSRLYALKPRALVQRRATITGASPTSKHAVDIEQFWKELKEEHSTTFQLRDKAASCAHGLDTVPSNLRPKTCLGIEPSKRKKRLEEVKNNENEIIAETRLNPSVNGTHSSKNIEDKSNSDSIIEKTNQTCDPLMPFTVNKTDSSEPPEIRRYCRNDRGKLDKSHSTPTYDVTEIRLVEKNTSNPQDSLGNNPNSMHSIEVIMANTNLNQDNTEIGKTLNIEAVRMEGNVAQKINFIEEKFRESITPEFKPNLINVPDVKNSHDNDSPKDLEGNGCEKSEIIHNSSNSATTNKIISSETQKESGDPSEQESSEGKSEPTSSYMEEIHNGRGEADAPLVKFEQTTLPLTVKHKTLDINVKTFPIVPLNIPSKIYGGSHLKENLSPQITVVPSIILKRDTQTSGNRKEYGLPSRRVIDPKECIKNSETKIRLTPPEPPPRKYFTKPSPLNLNINAIVPDPPERPKVSLNCSDLKTEIPKIDNSLNSGTIASSNQRESFEAYCDFVEKSTDFVDEPSTPIYERRPSIDHLGYSETYERQIKEDKPVSERYELFTEKFGNGNALIVQSQPEIVSHTADSPDGVGCSTQTPELKPRTLEKDKHGEKGVVNRAMMVARSIGLHSVSKSSSSSPRSSRKRNMLLAKRRNVSVKDIGAGELEGWLTYRSRGARGAWARSWFVLKESSLYRFKNHESVKSDCLIVLPGFTASQASEVKSRKFAFKVYHTGTVFYFAADTEDSLVLWLDSINKATLGADSHNRTSGLFSETDESDNEFKGKSKSTGLDLKSNADKAFGSLKKLGRKDSGAKDHEIGGASLDRKYLRFLGARTQNVPVPTAQFRSYRRVLPSSTLNRREESTSNSPDLRVTVAGSTFYALTSSHSSTDVPTSSQDMGDYRQTTDRSQSSRSRRPDDLRGFVNLEEFMLSHQQNDEQRSINNRSTSPRMTPLTNDHLHLQYRPYDDNNAYYFQNRSFNPEFSTNGMIYGHPRNGEDSSPFSTPSYDHTRNPGERLTPGRGETIYNQQSEPASFTNVTMEARAYERPPTISRKPWDQAGKYGKRPQENAVYYPPKYNFSHWQNFSTEITRVNSSLNGRSVCYSPYITSNMMGIHPRNESISLMRANDVRNRGFHRDDVLQPVPTKFIKDNGYSGSSGDLTCCTSSDTLQRARKEASVCRKGSFNISDRYREDKSWMDSLRRSDKKLNAGQKGKLKNVAQYQPPPIPSSPFEQDGMRAAFVMHLDKEHMPKTNKLKSFFGSKSPQKPGSLDLPKEQQKTLLGSPRLHRALFKDKNSNQKYQTRSGSQSPGDSGISQSLSSYSGISQSHTLSQSFSSVSSASDWSPETPSMNNEKYTVGHEHKKSYYRYQMNPPILPYIPPPSSPPPDDYPGLEYPPVFEPGTYSLSDASLLREKSKKNRNEREE